MRIAAFIHDQAHVTSYYRAVGPLSHIVKNNKNVSVKYTSTFKWSEIADCDIFFFHRPHLYDHESIIVYAKNMGLKVWLDYDDDLLNVSTDNPAFNVFEDDQAKKTLKRILSLADLLTVSTEELKKQYINYNSNIFTINNGVNLKLFPYFNPLEAYITRENLFMWRGSKTHHRDIMSVKKELIEFSHAENNSHIIEFLGDRLWFLTDHMKKGTYITTDTMDFFHYMQYCYQRKPKAFIVPLVNDTFNQSKSNIAWIEATMSHAIAITPNLDEWSNLPSIQYVNSIDFLDQMNNVANMDHSKLTYLVLESQKLIKEKYNLDILNIERLKLLTSLL